MNLRRFLRLERRVIQGREKPRPKPQSTDAARAEAEPVLATLLAKVAPGSRLSIPEIVAAAGCNEHVAARTRHWARSVHRWPYRNGLGGLAAARRKRGDS